MDLIFYLFGMLMAILSGISNNYGTVLQKKVVNRFRDADKFFKNLVKNPIWLVGLLLQNGVGAVLFFIAQIYIGPTLIPGLMAAGLIVLAIGAVRIVGEKLNTAEIIGIIIMILGIALLGFSNMVVDIADENFSDMFLFTRIMIFTLVIYGLAFFFYFLQLRNKFKGISLAIYSGFQFSLSNFWVSPLIGIIFLVFQGSASILEFILFVFSVIILTCTNIFGITSIQKAFIEGQASNLIPIQQVPIQLIPPFYFISVFMLPINNISSLFLLIMGIIFILISSFLLGKRQAQLEKIS
jgi:drug/metabolite transporter (DMT)-like permease